MPTANSRYRMTVSERSRWLERFNPLLNKGNLSATMTSIGMQYSSDRPGVRGRARLRLQRLVENSRNTIIRVIKAVGIQRRGSTPEFPQMWTGNLEGTLRQRRAQIWKQFLEYRLPVFDTSVWWKGRLAARKAAETRKRNRDLAEAEAETSSSSDTADTWTMPKLDRINLGIIGRQIAYVQAKRQRGLPTLASPTSSTSSVGVPFFDLYSVRKALASLPPERVLALPEYPYATRRKRRFEPPLP